MTRFLLSAVAFCALCVAMTGSADAAVRVTNKVVDPHGGVKKQTVTYGARHTTAKTTVVRPNGSSKTVKVRN